MGVLAGSAPEMTPLHNLQRTCSVIRIMPTNGVVASYPLCWGGEKVAHVASPQQKGGASQALRGLPRKRPRPSS